MLPHLLRSVGPIEQFIRILPGAIDGHDELTIFVRATAGLLDLNIAVGASMKPDPSQSDVGKPFPDFADGADDFRQANPVVEQLGDLTGAGQVPEAETAIPLVQQAQLCKLLDHADRHLAQGSKLLGRIGLLDIVRDGFADPFEKAALADDRDAKGCGAAQLIGGTTIIQKRPAELSDNENLRALCHRRARRSAALANNIERFSPAHARQPPCKGDRGLEC